MSGEFSDCIESFIDTPLYAEFLLFLEIEVTSTPFREERCRPRGSQPRGRRLAVGSRSTPEPVGLRVSVIAAGLFVGPGWLPEL
jgi:hypothetical protein